MVARKKKFIFKLPWLIFLLFIQVWLVWCAGTLHFSVTENFQNFCEYDGLPKNIGKRTLHS